MKVAGPFFFLGSKMPATEAPVQTIDERDAALASQLPAEFQEALATMNAEGAEPTHETPETPAETPAAETTAEVESATNAEVPGESTDAAHATTATPTPNAAVPPTAWQPSDDELADAKQLGVPEAVVRGFSSAKDFYRAVLLMRQQAPATPSPQTPAPKSPEQEVLDKLLLDPHADPDVVEAFKVLVKRDADRQATIEQIQQGTQQQLQAQHQRAQAEFFSQLHRELDGLDNEYLGKAESLTAEQQPRRQAVYEALYRMGQAGLVKELNRDSVERAFAFAFPNESREQLRRSFASAAKAQSGQRLTTGKPTGPARKAAPESPQDDPELDEVYDRLIASQKA